METPTLEDVHVKNLRLRSDPVHDIQEWMSQPNALYIGRANHYVGATASKWHNPFKATQGNSLEKALVKYEAFVRSTNLYSQLHELSGKILGCWCSSDSAPEREICHGHVLIRLFKEKFRK